MLIKKINILKFINKIIIPVLFLVMIHQQALLNNEMGNVSLPSKINFSPSKELESLFAHKFVFYGTLVAGGFFTIASLIAIIKYIVHDNKKKDNNQLVEKTEFDELKNQVDGFPNKLDNCVNKNELGQYVTQLEFEKNKIELKSCDKIHLLQEENKLLTENANKGIQKDLENVNNEKDRFILELKQKNEDLAKDIGLFKAELEKKSTLHIEELDEKQLKNMHSIDLITKNIEKQIQDIQQLAEKNIGNYNAEKENLLKIQEGFNTAILNFEKQKNQNSGELLKIKEQQEMRDREQNEKQNNHNQELIELEKQKLKNQEDRLKFEQAQLKAKETGAQEKKEWLTKNNDNIQEFINQIKLIIENIKENNDPFYYEQINVLYNDLSKIQECNLFYYLMCCFDVFKKIKWISEPEIPVEDFLLSSPEILIQLQLLKSVLNAEKIQRENNPERHSLYINNKNNIENLMDQIKDFLNNLQVITAKDNEHYLQIVNNKIESRVIFEYFSNLINNQDKLSGCYEYLSKDDKVVLGNCIKRINKETELRYKDQKRQYIYYLNQNQEIINQYKKKIKYFIEDKNADELVQWYKKYQNKQSAGVSDILCLIDENPKILDNEEEILNNLLQEDYDQFITEIHNKLEKAGMDLVAKQSKSLTLLINAIEKTDEITEEINTKYSDLILTIKQHAFDDNTFFSNINSFLNNNNVFAGIELKDYFIKKTNNFKIISDELNEFYNKFIQEEKTRRKFPGREYKWYINKYKIHIQNIKEKIKEITEGVKNNDAKWYEDYESVVFDENQKQNDYSEILQSIIFKNNFEEQLAIDKIVEYFKDDLGYLVDQFKQEKTNRKSSPERCFIGRKNKEALKNYVEKMEDFISNLSDQDNITEEINDSYEKIIAADETGQESNMFFDCTSKVMDIEFNEVNPIELYAIFGRESRIVIAGYKKAIYKEKNKRITNKKRINQWYINKIELKDHIKKINEGINSFIEDSKKDSSFENKINDDLYLFVVQHIDKEGVEIIHRLFDYYGIKIENIELNKLLHHVKWEELISQVKKEQSKRLMNPERSFYYSENALQINQITTLIDDCNLILGNIHQDTTEKVNIFFDKIIKTIYQSDLDLFCQVILVLNKKKKITEEDKKLYYFLSQDEREKVTLLKQNIESEKELRKHHASRGLSAGDKKTLQEFREWIKTDILQKLSFNSLIEEENIYNKCGIFGRSYDKIMLYKHYLELYFKEKHKQNDSILNTLLNNLDVTDKSQIDVIKNLLLKVESSLKDNQEKLSKEKRLLSNVKNIKDITSEELIIDDDQEIEALNRLKQELKNNENEVAAIVAAHEENINNFKKRIDDLCASLQDTEFKDTESKKFFIKIFKNLKKRYSLLPEENTQDFKNILKLAAYKILLEGNILSCMVFGKEYNRQIIKSIDSIDTLEDLAGFFIESKKLFNVRTYLENKKIFLNEGTVYPGDRIALIKDVLLIFMVLGDFIKNDKECLKRIIASNDIGKFKLLLPMLYEIPDDIFQLGFALFNRIYPDWFTAKKEEKKFYIPKELFFKDHKFIGFDSLLSNNEFITAIEKKLTEALAAERENDRPVHKKAQEGFKEAIGKYLNLFFDNTIYSNSRIHPFIKELAQLINYFFYDQGLMIDNNIKKLPSKYYSSSNDERWKESKEIIQNHVSELFKNIDTSITIQDNDFDGFFLISDGNEKKPLPNILNKKRKEEIIQNYSIMMNDRKNDKISPYSQKIIKLKENIENLEKTIDGKKKDDMLSARHIEDIPRQCIMYQWKIRIANKIRDLLSNQNELYDLFEKIQNIDDDTDLQNEKENKNNNFNHLFKIIQYIDRDDNTAFLYSIMDVEYVKNKIENLKSKDEKTIKIAEFLNLLLNGDYNLNSKKEHYLFAGDPGTGKSAFLPFALQKFIAGVSKRNSDLGKYLNENINIFIISKGYYDAQGSVEKGLPGDIDTIIATQSRSKLLFVLYDECDAFVANKTEDKNNEDKGEINTFLTTMDRSKDKPYCFFGTSNLTDYNPASIRLGRLNLIWVPKPTVYAFTAFLEQQKNTEKTLSELTKNTSNKEEYKKKVKTIEWILIKKGSLDNINNFNEMKRLIESTETRL